MVQAAKLQSDPLLKKLEAFFQGETEVQFALVFGSFAKGTQTPNSDLDLACKFGHPLTIDERLSWVDRISKLTGREVDLVDLAVATGTVLREAMTTGVLLKKGEPIILATVLKRMWLEHEDFEKQRQRVLADRRKKVLGA